MEQETRLEDRFEFGRNWSDFLKKMDPQRIREAEESLAGYLGTDLAGQEFLDIGCGSGLFSLAARNLGARVTSFDFDPDSVACAEKLRENFHPEDAGWSIRQGSVLDRGMLAGLGWFDVVYSWGVLHHTGRMWEALDNATSLVRDGGRLFISIYNDQGGYSDLWRAIKRTYVRSPDWFRFMLCLGVLTFMEMRYTLIQLVRLRNPIRMYRARTQGRGMALWHDLKDWVGGYPFEVAKPEEIFDFCRDRGFELLHLKTNGGGIACNEYVFRKHQDRELNEL